MHSRHSFEEHDHGRMIPRLLFICSKCDEQVYVWFDKKYYKTYLERLSKMQECFLFFDLKSHQSFPDGDNNVIALSDDGSEFPYLGSHLDKCPVSDDEVIVKDIIK